MTQQGSQRAFARVREAVATKLRTHRPLRFLLAGFVNTGFGFAVYTTCILASLSVRSALLTGLVAGSVFNFVTTGGYAFRQLAIRRYPLFLVSYGIVYVLNVAMVEWLAPRVGGAIVAQALSLVPMALLSYWLMARWVFNRA